MKVLSINVVYPETPDPIPNIEKKESNFHDSICFGNDVVIINPESVEALLHHSVTHDVLRQDMGKWGIGLNKWIRGGGIAVVLFRPRVISTLLADVTNYSWVPLENFNPNLIVDTGAHNEFAGDIVSSHRPISDFLDEGKYYVMANLTRTAATDPAITDDARIDEETLTAFTIRLERGALHFLPVPQDSNRLLALAQRLRISDTALTVKEKEELREQVRQKDAELQKVTEEKQALEVSIAVINSNLEKIRESDIYLGKALALLAQISATEHPDPDVFYRIVESLENAFDNETTMRSTLGLSKSEVGKLTKRTNEFRHEQVAGTEPQPLSPEEIEEFKSVVNKAVDAYIQHLYTKLIAAG